MILSTPRNGIAQSVDDAGAFMSNGGIVEESALRSSSKTSESAAPESFSSKILAGRDADLNSYDTLEKTDESPSF